MKYVSYQFLHSLYNTKHAKGRQMLEEMEVAKRAASSKNKERREGIANCKTDRKLAKMMTTLVAGRSIFPITQSGDLISTKISFVKKTPAVGFSNMG